MSKLEERLGVRLLNRSTRSVSLSEAGAHCCNDCNQRWQESPKLFEDLNSLRESPSGILRLNVPRAAAHLVLAPQVAAFHQVYPDIQLEIVVSDQLVDIVAQGFDAVFASVRACSKI